MSRTSKRLIAALVGCVLAVLAGYYLRTRVPPPDLTGETRASMYIIMSAIEEYRKDTGNYPSESGWISELKANAESRKRMGILSESAWSAKNPDEFRDMWGTAIKYFPRGGLAETPELTSAGPDGDMTTEEDNVGCPR